MYLEIPFSTVEATVTAFSSEVFLLRVAMVTPFSLEDELVSVPIGLT